MKSLSYVGEKNIFMPREPMTVHRTSFGRRVQTTVPREPIQGKVHIYQDAHGKEYLIKKAMASIYCDQESDETAITFMLKDAEGQIIPIHLWRPQDKGYYWDVLLSWPENEVDLVARVNPILNLGEKDTFRTHPLIEPINEIASQYKLPSLQGKIAKSLNYFVFSQRLNHIMHQDKILWDHFSHAQKIQELIERKEKNAVELLSFAQAVMEIDKDYTCIFSHSVATHRSNW